MIYNFKKTFNLCCGESAKRDIINDKLYIPSKCNLSPNFTLVICIAYGRKKVSHLSIIKAAVS